MSDAERACENQLTDISLSARWLQSRVALRSPAPGFQFPTSPGARFDRFEDHHWITIMSDGVYAADKPLPDSELPSMFGELVRLSVTTLYVGADARVTLDRLRSALSYVPPSVSVRGLIVHGPDDKDVVARQVTRPQWYASWQSATTYDQRRQLAQPLWRKAARECNLLASMAAGLAKLHDARAHLSGEYAALQAARECKCANVDMTLLRQLVLAHGGAYDRRVGWIPVPTSDVTATHKNVEDYARSYELTEAPEPTVTKPRPLSVSLACHNKLKSMSERLARLAKRKHPPWLMWGYKLAIGNGHAKTEQGRTLAIHNNALYLNRKAIASNTQRTIDRFRIEPLEVLAINTPIRYLAADRAVPVVRLLQLIEVLPAQWHNVRFLVQRATGTYRPDQSPSARVRDHYRHL